MRRAFLTYLAAEGVVPADRLDDLHAQLRGAPEPIGAIAFSYGMITGADIDDILDEQRRDKRPFGKIAISKGLLTAEQVDTLLCIQRIRAATETAEALALSGACTFDEIVTQLGRFLLAMHGCPTEAH